MLLNHMVENNDTIGIVARAIADPVRRQILTELKSGPATVGQLGAPHDMTFAGVAKHLKILVDARLVKKTKAGRQQICTLDASTMRSLQAWLQEYEEFWDERLDALEAAVKEFESEK